MEAYSLSHSSAARLMKIPTAELVDLLRGRTSPYTVDGLKEFLRRLAA